MQLHRHSYGKQRVRLTYLDRTSRPHRVVICAVGIGLEGAFDESYTAGDNRRVVATDTMKNTVYVLAREQGVASIERFALLLAQHFAEYEQVARATIEVEQEVWAGIEGVDPAAAGAALVRASGELDVASAEHAGDGSRVTSGIDRLQVMKTENSGFSDFHRDRFTTLADTEDRLFATTIQARWQVDGASSPGDPSALAVLDGQRRAAVRRTLLRAFAEHRSRSVQETLYAMGTAVLNEQEGITEITLRLPNQHHLLVDLSRFDLDNPNVVFVGTDEPFGNIEATLRR